MRPFFLSRTIFQVAACAAFAASAGAEEGIAFFEQKVRPVLVEHCYECHSADAKKVKGGLVLDTKVGWERGGDSGKPAILPGKPEESLFIQSVRHLDPDLAMPVKKPKLPDAVIADLVAWVKMGAPDPRTGAPETARRADKSWWSLQPIKDVVPPAAEGAPGEWRESAIDRFVYQKLAEKGLKPGAPAEPRTLIRRMAYDVTGLPPSAEEMDAFVGDFARDGEKAVVALVDRLLASPRYGEQWGRHWLDVIRFGESTGFERNVIIDNLWPFRDYVIRSINEDKPFDRFIVEQIAGDVIAPDDPHVSIGSAFLVAGPYDNVGNQDAVATANIRAVTLDDLITTTSSAFLGLTINCARCHHHKFDPIPTEDYYRIRAAFEGVTHGERAVASKEEKEKHAAALHPLNEAREKLKAEKAELEKAKEPKEKIAEANRRLEENKKQIAAVPGPRMLWAGNFAQPAVKTFVHKGGDPMKPGAEVVPASLSVLGARAYELPSGAPEGQRRKALAEWIASPENHLTQRVLANRVWHYHFGTGLVDSPGDFGFLGGQPSHPELLDWLARRLVAHGWKLKPLHREILLSAAYRQSSVFREDASRADKDARLLWRFPPRRFAAEEVRDSMLAATGALDLKIGGPGFRLYKFSMDNVCTYTPLDKHGPETYRRAVYHQNARASVVDILADFDFPDTAFAAPRRANTTTPFQALTLLNHSFSIDMAARLAERSRAACGNGSAAEVIKAAFRFALLRAPSAPELAGAEHLAATHGVDAVCRALLNSNEFLYLE